MKEKTYQVDLYRNYRHGCYKSEYGGIGSFVVTATSKKQAKDIVLDNLVGELAKNFNFPIDPKYAPEYHLTENNGVLYYTGKQVEVDKHIINEYDIQLKNQIVADIAIID